ncbi:MAG TPA: PAS domain S-box protein [Candidatus Acidoferrum sp.]|nr:PAS domain S-box protein [Candidatus Acidoferrum sp.]
MEVFKALFLSSGFQPHGFCYQWNTGLVWLNVLSDLTIGLAYFAIPVILLWFIRKRTDLPFGWMFGLFGVFIIACGGTHVMEVWNLWHTQYWLAGAIKAITATASILTAGLLVRVMPQAVDLPGTQQWRQANSALQQEVHEHKDLELELRLREAKYREIAELLDLTHDAILVCNLRNEVMFWNKAAETLYGWRQEEAKGKAMHELLQTVFPRPLAEINAEVLENGYWEGELLHRRRDGTVLTISSRWAVRRDDSGDPVAILESNRDMTRQKREQERFKNLLEAAPDAMVSVNQAGEIQLVNSQTEKLFGYSREEILGKPVEILVPQRFRGRHEAHRGEYSELPVRRAMGAGLELYGLRKDGTEFAVEISLSPIETMEGALTISAIRDISDRKKTEEALRQSEELFRLLVSGVEDYAILMLDREGRVVSWNNGAERIKGYRAEEILGQHFSRFYAPEDVERGKPVLALKLAAENGGFNDEGWRVRKDGTRFWANVAITALHDEKGQLRGFGKVTRDSTERKQSQDALERQRNELARSNAEMTAANRELEAFSYSVSHDLRAPLRSIDGFSLALLEDYSEKLDDEGKKHLERVRAATQRMGTLIDDLLDLARVTRASMRLETVNVSEAATEVAEGLQKAQPSRKVEIRIEEGLEAIVDSHLLRIVLENLLGNAWKFTSKHASACIEFGRTTHNGTSAFFVRDDGAGFDSAYADRLFGAFQRLHAMTDFPGTGVGLATVQRIIHRHGGRIWAESSVGRGATFYFTLANSTS